MNRELYPCIEKFLKDNDLTIEDMQTFVEEMEKTKLAQEKRKQVEELQKKKESLLGKYFMELKGGYKPVFYKVLSSDSYNYLICLRCPSSTHLGYYFDDDDSIVINDDICVISVRYEEFMKMAPITAEDFAAVVDAWGKKLLTLELP